MSSGYGSGQRMPSQQTYEAPACVQNAMMTKDKKPFTYTPGGIDLSQIKSERMAKRLARNAQAEGATGAQQHNRPTQPQSPGQSSPNAAASSMGAAAMGMPFQVLPPPAPPAPGFKKTMPTTTTNNNNALQQNQTNNNYTNYPQQQPQQLYTPPTPPQQQQQSPIKPMQQSPQYGAGPQPPLSSSPAQQQTHMTQQQSPQQQLSSRPEFRSVAVPTSPAVNVYTRQTDSPRSVENNTPPRATESPFKFAQQQQQQQLQQQRAPPSVSPLAQQSTPSTASSGASVSPNNQAQAVPWRTQRSQTQQPQQQQASPSVVAQSHPQPIYNNVQQQRTPDFTTQQSAYQGPKPTNVGSLYIAPLAPPTEPQAQHIVRQQMQQQQQQQQRDSPMRQMAPTQQQPAGQQAGAPQQQLRWMSTQPLAKEQPAWARPEENGNVVPSSINRIKSPPPATAQAQSQAMPPQQQYQPLNTGNGFMPQTAVHNFGAQPMNTTGLRLQINTPAANQTNSQNGPKERIIPIQLEQTPTYTPAQPSFNQQQQQQYGPGAPGPGYVVRTPNQFVDQGYNNFGQQQQQQQQQQMQQQSQPQRVMSPTLQQLNAPRMVQQTQNNVAATGNKTHIIPIALENNEGTRGPISKTPIVIQNDQRTPPVQSKSFRILQKITDTIDDASNDDNANQQQQQQIQPPAEPQLQRPTFARQMSAQQARHSPTVEQMRRMQIGHEQDNSQQYIPPSEQQVPEPKKYTGSAIPSRSFKILQAMTQPENAGPGQSDL